MPSLKGTKWRQITPYLIFCVLVYLQGALLFGIDTGSFGSLQALPSFLNQFGVKNAKGKLVLPTERKSVMNSVPWIGKIVGCWIVEPMLERVGYRNSMLITAGMQVVSLIIEVTSKNWIQFTIGRNFAYFTVGLVENLVPAYIAEISPAAHRGLLAGQLTVVVSVGNLWGAGMSRAFYQTQSKKGWIVPSAVQMIPAAILLALLPFTPESPRWLVLHGQKEKALKQLDRLRTKEDVDNGYTMAEVDAIEQAIVEGQATEQGSWLDLFRGNYLRRSWICGSLFAFQQTNGNQFINSYGPTFYVQYGLGSKSFTYSTLGQMMVVLGSAFGIFFTDRFGRRPMMIYGAAFLTFFMFLASGLGSKKNATPAQVNTMVASFIIIGAFTKISASNNAFLSGAEIGGVKMRKKIMAFGTTIDVLAAFLVTFVTPYLLADPGPNLSAKIGFIFAGAALLSFLFGVFFYPELNGRSLEEVDELFEANLWAWQFKKYQTHGVGHRLTELEMHRTSVKEDTAGFKADAEHNDEGVTQPTAVL